MSSQSGYWKWVSWNPVTGCTKISEGCRFCYASEFAERLKSKGVEKYKNGFEPTLHYDVLDYPNRWKKPRMIFVTSMSDLFNEKVPDEFIFEVFKLMNATPRHIFQLLTKRAERLSQLNNKVKWTPNIWMGVTVENKVVENRIKLLRNTGARIKFLSCEPLIGPLQNIDLSGIDWIRAGEETGKTPRPMKQEWVEDPRIQCEQTNVTFSLKNKDELNTRKDAVFRNGKKYNEEFQFDLFS